MVEILNGNVYPRRDSKGRWIVVDPNRIPHMPMRGGWFNQRGEARSVAEGEVIINGRKVKSKIVGPDDGDKLG